MIEFDRYGNLLPYEIVSTNLHTFETCFVNEMRNKEHRKQIFTNYIEYITQLNSLITNNYFQWINGSFVTKALSPNDIDLVSFIDYKIVQKHTSELNFFMYPFSKTIYNVDAYVVIVYPQDHKNYRFYHADNLYWLHQFLKTKPNKQGIQRNKGFIKIDMSHEKLQ